jgi:predicted ATPase
MRHIKRVEISGFKSIRDISGSDGTTGSAGLLLGDVNVLIGANGAGKSNFLSFFELLQAIFDQKLQFFTGVSGGANRLLYFGRKTSERVSGRIEFAEVEAWYEWTLVPTMDEHLVFEFERELFDWFNPNSYAQGGGLGTPSILDGGRPGSREAEGIFHDNTTANAIRELFNQMAPIQVCHFADMGAASPARQNADLNDNRSLRSDGRNIAPFLYLLKANHPVSYRRVVDAVRLVFPFFQDFVLEPLELNKKMIHLEWTESGTDDYRNASYLSDGALRFICLAALLLQPNPPGLIQIDEPELGLHPFAIEVLSELLQAVARSASQVIVSTQSVTLVNRFGPEDIVVVERHKEQGSSRHESTFKRLEKADWEGWLEEYAVGELWEKNIIGGRPSHA